MNVVPNKGGVRKNVLNVFMKKLENGPIDMKFLKRIFTKRYTAWSDICTFTYGHDGYILQGKRHKRSNRAKFSVTKLGHRVGVVNTSMSLEDLHKKLPEQ